MSWRPTGVADAHELARAFRASAKRRRSRARQRAPGNEGLRAECWFEEARSGRSAGSRGLEEGPAPTACAKAGRRWDAPIAAWSDMMRGSSIPIMARNIAPATRGAWPVTTRESFLGTPSWRAAPR